MKGGLSYILCLTIITSYLFTPYHTRQRQVLYQFKLVLLFRVLPSQFSLVMHELTVFFNEGMSL